MEDVMRVITPDICVYLEGQQISNIIPIAPKILGWSSTLVSSQKYILIEIFNFLQFRY